jgi:hypothetical protein
MTRSFLALIAAAALSVSCSNAPTTPDNDDDTPTKTVAYFTGAMSPGESQFYSFTVQTTESTEVTLVSLLPEKASSPALAIPMSIGLGTPSGTGCRLAAAVVTAPGLTAQLTMPTTPTIFCAQIADAGQLTGPVSFTVKIVHP